MASRLSRDFPHTHSYPGANRPLYYDPHDSPDEPFDVRADFDAEGPRWSERYGQRTDAESLKGGRDSMGAGAGTSSKGGYMLVNDGSKRPSGSVGAKKSADGEELVSVPVLGPEWQKSELHELTRRGQAEVRAEGRTRRWREWTRDQRGTFGVKWLTRRMLVFGLFFFLVGLGITLFFVIPRPPTFAFYTPSPFTVDNSTVSFSRTPTNFSFTGNLNLLADASSSYLPVHFTNIHATLYDLNTAKAIATGDYGNHRVARKNDQPVVLPVQFSYSALNASDTTWNDMYSACGHLWPGSERPDLKLKLILEMSIVGLVSKPKGYTQISDVTCPFELPSNSV